MTLRLKNAHGFTLLELILSLGIVGFIVAISMSGVRLGMSARDVGEKKAEAFQRFRIIEAQLTQKIKSTYPLFVAQKDGETFARQETPSAAQRTLAFAGEPDSLRFISFATPLTADNTPPWAHEVRVYLGAHPQTGERGVILMERDIGVEDVFAKDPKRSKRARHFLLAADVADLRFRYYTLEEERSNAAQNENAAKRYKGSWVNRVRYEKASEPKKDAPGQKSPQEQKRSITLPKGVEIRIGWQEAESQIRYSPPIVVPLHTGMEFKLLEPEKDATS